MVLSLKVVLWLVVSFASAYHPGRDAFLGPDIFSAEPCPSSVPASVDATSLLAKLNSSLADLDKAITSALAEDNSPGGGVISLVYKNVTIWSKGYGLKNMSDPSSGAPDENTGFRIGSITKVMTALQTLIARDGGVIKSLDDDIYTYDPVFYIPNPYQTKRGITFRQLMSHMSGLPRNIPCPEMFVTGCNLSRTAIYANTATHLKLLFPPGSNAAYSNLGFALLGQIIANTQEMAWADSIKKLVFEPLNMTNTGNSYGPDDLAKMAVGYYPDGRQAGWLDVGWGYPAGQSYSTTADLAKLMYFVFGGMRKNIGLDISQVIDGETLREWFDPAYIFPDGTGFSYPWELKPLGSYVLHGKDGIMNGYNAQFTMAVESKLGYIFLQSCDGCSSHSKILQLAENLLQEAIGILAANVPPPKMPPTPHDYMGNFNASDNQGWINITMYTVSNYPTLFLIDGAYNVSLQWEQEDYFYTSTWGTSLLCSLLHTGHIGSRIHFTRDSTGHVTSLVLPGLNFGVTYSKN